MGAFDPVYIGNSGRVDFITYPNGQKADFDYHPNSLDKRLKEIKNVGPTGNVISKFNYVYDVTGQITEWTQFNPGMTAGERHVIGPDAADQLHTIDVRDENTNALLQQFTYGYDLAGNRTSEQIDAGVTTWAPNAFNQLVSQSGSGGARSFTYDSNGAMTDDGATRTFEWDAAGRLYAINYTGTTNRTEFGYDGLSRRVKIVEKTNGTVTSEKHLAWEGMAILEERDASDTVIKRYFPEGQLEGTSYFYTRDHLGSVREVTDSTGSVLNSYEYDAYGRQTPIYQSPSGKSDFGYTGHYIHQLSGLHLAPYRAYDAPLGRWLSRDPIGESGGRNLYGYVHNRPVQFRDPRGLQVEEDITEEMVEHEIRMIANLIRRIAGMSELNEANEAEPFRIEISRPAFDEWLKSAEPTSSSAITCPVHGNSLLSPKPTSLYSLWDLETGSFLKWGITSEPTIEDRYPSSFLEGKFMLEEAIGSRYEMRQFEMQLIDQSPGPLNRR